MFGPIVWSIVAVVVALVVLAVLVVGLLRHANRTTTVLGAFTALLGDRLGLLRARVAALQVRLARRRAPAGSPVQSGPGTEGAPS
ncbi:hypothetical protein [Actinomycetospora termitidis]|uniref:Secreted protein n=1 Tax=Actinomycetospora termitidis TaxID=3053470 RepID=A0ABT7MC09_9PSEU|nr:hypothetical protein [Actinomycetospora sp. Odt1-22]MDL5158178.1 hypothetical protein [Actinomycetospora sp. Odt1-22]